MKSERNSYIDFLRFVGLSLVVLAHIKAPNMLFQIRCFDVPLMVFVSGLSYSGKVINPSFKSYYFPRICRLVIPVYLFLLCYFGLFAGIGKPQSFQMIFSSFLLMNEGSIGFVWIIKVFLLVMLVTPLLLRLSNVLNFYKVLVLCILMLVVNDIIYLNLIKLIDNNAFNLAFTETIPYLIGYSAIFLVGSKCREIKNNEECVTLISLGALLSFYIIRFSLQGLSIDLQPYKYPPMSYFLLYGLLCSLLLWKCRNITFFKHISSSRFVLLVGRNTIWIYLWHIIFVKIANDLIPYWGGRFVFVYFASIACFGIQFYLVKRLQSRFNWSFLKYFLG